jgi:hypothetical protein
MKMLYLNVNLWDVDFDKRVQGLYFVDEIHTLSINIEGVDSNDILQCKFNLLCKLPNYHIIYISTSTGLGDVKMSIIQQCKCIVRLFSLNLDINDINVNEIKNNSNITYYPMCDNNYFDDDNKIKTYCKNTQINANISTEPSN